MPLGVICVGKGSAWASSGVRGVSARRGRRVGDRSTRRESADVHAQTGLNAIGVYSGASAENEKGWALSLMVLIFVLSLMVLILVLSLMVLMFVRSLTVSMHEATLFTRLHVSIQKEACRTPSCVPRSIVQNVWSWPS